MKLNGSNRSWNPVWQIINPFVVLEIVIFKLVLGLVAVAAAFVILDAFWDSLKRISKRNGGALPEVQDKWSALPVKQSSLAKMEELKSQESHVSLPESEIETANKKLEEVQKPKTELQKPVALSPEELKQTTIKELLRG